MNDNMHETFALLKKRVEDSLSVTDLEHIKYELSLLDKPTILTGVGGSSVVSEFAAKVLNKKNEIVTINSEPRDMLYRNNDSFSNVIACSYSGNNHGVTLSFSNHLKKYLFTNNDEKLNDVTCLQYKSTYAKEKSFISLASTLIPCSILLDYYLGREDDLLTKLITPSDYKFSKKFPVIEIFSGYDTSSASKYLESTMTEAGLALAIVHDKYNYCHGRSTLSTVSKNKAIFLNGNNELDDLLLEEIKPYYKDITILSSEFKNPILRDYDLLIKSMYLTKSLAESEERDISNVNYSPVCKKLYKYKGNM